MFNEFSLKFEKTRLAFFFEFDGIEDILIATFCMSAINVSSYDLVN